MRSTPRCLFVNMYYVTDHSKIALILCSYLQYLAATKVGRLKPPRPPLLLYMALLISGSVATAWIMRRCLNNLGSCPNLYSLVPGRNKSCLASNVCSKFQHRVAHHVCHTLWQSCLTVSFLPVKISTLTHHTPAIAGHFYISVFASVIMIALMLVSSMAVQWNPSIVATIGKQNLSFIEGWSYLRG